MSKTKIRILQIAVLLVVAVTLLAVNSAVYVPNFIAYQDDMSTYVNSSVHSTSPPPNPEAYGLTQTNIIIFYALGLVGSTMLLLGAVLLFILVVTKLPLDRFQKRRPPTGS
ncbi:MAG: hypothetical protein ACQCN6_13205 [Candidatus Bathyarchaeia archaeon]|jgi:hypothetical protein